MTSNVEDEPVLTNEPLLTNERVVGGVKDELGSITVSDIWPPPPPFIFVPLFHWVRLGFEARGPSAAARKG